MSPRDDRGTGPAGAAAAPPGPRGVQRAGRWASWTAFLAAVAYTVAQLLSPPLLPVLPPPWSDLLIFAPSLVLPLALLVALNALHERTPPGRRFWTRTGTGFALLYAALVGSVYVVQLAVVIPARVAGTGAAVEDLSLSSPWVQAVDGLGYAMMSLAFLFVAGSLDGTGRDRTARRWFLAHGALAPVVVLPLWVPPMLLLGTLWFVTAPGALWQTVRLLGPPGPVTRRG